MSGRTLRGLPRTVYSPAVRSHLLSALAGAVATAATPALLAQDASRGIPYAGHLELDGVPVAGPVALTFYLYDAFQGGTQVWSESHPTVEVADGAFSVQLGLSTPIGPELRPYGDLFLEISINGQRLTGRQPLGAVPFAYRGAPGSDFVVDGDLEFGSSCPGGDPAACQPKRCTGGAWVEIPGGYATGFNSVSIQFDRTFGGTPSVVVTPACTTPPCGTITSSPFLTRVDSDGFVLGWRDYVATTGPRRFHWMAVGPCP